MAFIKDRLVSFVMVIGVGVLMVVAATAGVILTFLGSIFTFEATVPLINLVTFMLLATLSTGLIYKILPEGKIAWRDVWLGQQLRRC